MRTSLILLLAAGTSLHAQSFTGTYTFGSAGNVAEFAYNGTDIDNLTEGAMVKSAGITTSSSSNNFRATGWTTSTSIDTGDYIGFSLTAAEGYEIDMSSISFGIGRSGTGTRNWIWRSSADNFAADLDVYDTLATGVTNTSGVLSHGDTSSNWTGIVLNLSALAATSTIEFRLYSYSAEVNTGTAGLAGALTFAGTLTSTTPPSNDGTGLYWAGSGSGGSGTWTGAGTTFATDATFATSGLGIGSGTVVFAGTAGTVTLGEAISVASGLQFSTTSYILTDSTLTLSGANLAANTITVDSAVSATISSVIAGSNGLTKSGAGTLTLSGANTYTGGTTVALGSLVGSVASIRGAVLNNGTVTLNEASDATFSEAITGTGSLTKDGAGTLTLSGANTYSGGTTVTAGAIKGDTTSIQRSIVNNAAVIFDQASAGTHSGSISGTGSVTKLGAGALTLSGSNSYTGGTTVSAGSLIGSTSSLQGDITNNAAITFSQSGSGSYSGIISGTGSLTKEGTGAVTLSGANTYSGGTTISAGTLIGTTTSLQRDITNNAALVFSQSDDGTYAGIISGTGSVAKSGAGTLTLSGANTFEGGLSVSGGNVRLASADAASSGAIQLNGGGLLVNGSVNLARSITVGAAGGLFISEYLESSSQKYVEIYNATGATVDLSGYELALYTNGAASAGTITVLSGSLAADSVAVYRNSSSNLVLPNEFSATSAGAVNFNGDDAIALRVVGGSVIDVIGIIGNDPGTSWSSNGVKTEDGTITRSASISVGNPAFSLESLGSEWSFTSTVNGSTLGSHTLSGGGAGTGSGTLGLAEAGSATFSGNVTIHGAATLTAAASGTATFSGILSGAGSVTKTGDGIVVLSSANTFSGGTTISAGTLRIGDIAALGTGNVAVSGGILDLNNLAPTNVIVISGGSLANASAWAALGEIELSGNVGSDVINALEGIAEVKVAAGATVDLTGVTKDIVFEGGTLANLTNFGSDRKVKVKGNLDVSAGDHGGEIEVAAGGTLDFGNRASNRSVKFAGGAITGANFTGTVDVDSAAGTVDLTSSIGAGNVRLGNGAAASIQAGFNRALRLEDGATLSGLNNYSGELTVAAPTFSTSGITTSATIAIESGTTLSGTGTVGSVVQVAGSTLAPGNSPGILNVTGAHVLAGGATMEVEFYDLATSQARGTAYDAVTAGTLDLSGLTTLSRYTLSLISLSSLPSTQGALAGFDNSTAYLFELFTYATLTLPASYSGNIADLFTIDTTSFADSSGNPVTGSWTLFNNTGTSTLELQYSPIPEPSTYGLILGGLALAGAAIRRRKAKTSK